MKKLQEKQKTLSEEFMNKLNVLLGDELTCHDLTFITSFLDNLHGYLLFSYEDAGTSPLAEQEFLAAIHHLELATTCMTKADLHQARGD